ncbi:helix-turn-helix domain-containing protein [soil metagenome]|jgi:transcriptional regulator GlxA family with amidase domain
MVQLGILLTQHNRLLSVAAILDVFESVNRFYRLDGETPFFNINIIGAGNADNAHYSQYKIQSFEADTQFDVVLIPALACEDMRQAITENSKYFNWICGQYQQGAEVACVCTGAFLLAAAGLLNGKTASTHMDSADIFAKTFPLVNLQAHAVVTQDQRIYTSGGATSTFHLLLQLIENHCGRDMAIRIAKYFAIDMDREHQAYFGTFKPIENHEDDLVKKLQERIKKDYATMTSIEGMLDDIPASRRNLFRRFKQATGNTPIEYVQKVRIEAAKRALEKASGNVQESMFESGYSDLKTFRELFKKTVGITPSEYRSKYSRKAVDVEESRK